MEVLDHFRVSAASPSPRSNHWICISRRCRPQSQVFSPNVLNLLQFLSTVWFVCSGNTPRPAVQECQTKPADAEGGCIQRGRNLPQDIPPLLPNSRVWQFWYTCTVYYGHLLTSPRAAGSTRVRRMALRWLEVEWCVFILFCVYSGGIFQFT